MARATIRPSKLHGSVTPPPSRAHALRLAWGACLGNGGAIGNCPDTPDLRAIAGVARQLDVDVEFEDNVFDVLAFGRPDPALALDCGSSRLAARFALPLAAFFAKGITLTAPPIPKPAFDALERLAMQSGMRVSNESRTLFVHGPPTSQWLALRGHAGAYWASGWLMALPLPDSTIEVMLDEVTMAHPSVRLTLHVLGQFGLLYALEPNDRVLTIPAGQEYPSRYMDAEADWRTGAYLLAAPLLSGRGRIRLSSFSGQPEREFFRPLEQPDGPIAWGPDGLEAQARESDALPLPETWDVAAHPALVPLAMVLATRAAQSVRIPVPVSALSKSRKRAYAMTQALAKLGALVTADEEGVLIRPGAIRGGTLDCGGDTRIAMALGLAGLCASGPITVENAQAVSSVHPGFWNDLRELGAEVRMSFSKKSEAAGVAKEAEK